jgi:hypothetical protein
MAKHTQKNDALGMFGNTKPVNIKKQPAKETPKKAEIVEEVEKKAPKAEKVEEKAPEKKAEPKVEQEAAPVETPVLSGMGLKLTMDLEKKERTKRTRCFYLSDETYEKLVEMSKKSQSNASEYLEFILKQVLFN